MLRRRQSLIKRPECKIGLHGYRKTLPFVSEENSDFLMSSNAAISSRH